MLSLADPSVRAVYGSGSAAARTLGLRVRIPSGGHECLSVVFDECWQVEVSASG